jgi:hypothetical protein
LIKLKRRLKHQKEKCCWYFVFQQDDGYLPWWARTFLSENYGHVFAISQAGPVTTEVNSKHSKLHIDVRYNEDNTPLNVDMLAIAYKMEGYIVVRWDGYYTKDFTSHHWTNFCAGCVTVCKGLIGIAEPIFTPYQFFRYLVYNGGIVLTQEIVTEYIQTGEWATTNIRGNHSGNEETDEARQ